MITIPTLQMKKLSLRKAFTKDTQPVQVFIKGTQMAVYLHLVLSDSKATNSIHWATATPS